MVKELELKDEYPTEIVASLMGLGIFGAMIAEDCGGLEQVSNRCPRGRPKRWTH
jgi:hypothetical protein